MIIDVEQGTEAWHRLRLGKVTASRFKDVLATLKSGEAASRRNYRAQLVCERLTGVYADRFQSAAMLAGIEAEPRARAAYEIHTGNFVEQVGFVSDDDMEVGVSPDGLVGDFGLIEIKCVIPATQIDTLLNGFPSEHKAQVQGQMWITGRQWVDFVSYNERVPGEMRFFIERVWREQSYIDKLKEEVVKFLNELDAMIETLHEVIRKRKEDDSGISK